MSRYLLFLRLSTLVALLLLWCGIAHAAAAPAASPQVDGSRSAGPTEASGAARTFLLMATLNGVGGDDPMVVRCLGARVWMRATDLRALGLRTVAGSGEVDLATLPGLHFAIDQAAQAIALLSLDGARQQLRLADGRAPPAGRPTANGWGAILNYDVSATRAAARSSAGGTVEAVVYTPRGYLYTGAVGIARSRGEHGRLARLDIGYTYADERSMRRVTVGDFINAASSFSRPVRMAGVKLGTDFSVRPDLVTFPIPALNGSAAVPSAVDVIVNGNRRAAGEVRAGQFSVSDVPVQTGVNTITVAVRDALGRQTLQTVTTYASRALLRPGLAAWSAEVGAIRTGYATDHDRYRRLAGSGSARLGISEALTIEGHAEASSGVGTAGVGATLAAGRFGLVDGSVAAGPHGLQLAVGFERIGRPVSFSARYIRNSRRWNDLASRYGSLTRSYSLVANLGFDLARFGTLGISVIDLGRGRASYDGTGRALSYGPTEALRSRLINTTYSVRVADRVSLVANLGIDLRQRRSTFASLGALLVFGPRTSAYAGLLQRTGDTTASAAVIRNAVEPGQWGYRADVAAGGVDRIGGGAEYLGRHGHVEAQAEITNGTFAAHASARGALVLAGGHLFAGDTVTDSFAVVDAAGHAGVPIYRDHHRIGVTDRHGRLFVGNLAAYQATTFSIDPTELDGATTIADTEAAVRPMERVGVRAGFALADDRSVVLHLVDAAGQPLPAGARADYAGQELPIGLDGEVYLATPGRDRALTVRLPGGQSCTAILPAMSSGRRLPPLPCRSTIIADRGGP